MSSPKLPLQVRVGIRDHWDMEGAPVQTARSTVKELLGIDVVVEVAWELLLFNLDNEYPDKSTFAPSIAAAVKAFFDGLHEILDMELNSGWTDTLLERAKSCLRIFIGVSKAEEPTVLWSGKGGNLNVNLPRGAMPPWSEMKSLFKAKLLECFDEPSPPLEGWAEVSIGAVDDESPLKKPYDTLETLPDINVIPRPDELLLKPPYHLVVYGGSKTMVEVQCSHSPTLELLAEYLKKWCKTNHQDTRHPPAVNMKLHQSAFGFGLTYDRLTMSVEDRNPHFLVSPMVVLSFVRTVLGYKSISVDGASWVFERDIEFRNIRQ